MAEPRLPVSSPEIGPREIDAVCACLRSGWVSSAAPQVAEFERRWASYCGRAHGVAVSSGTAALQLALACLELKPEDEVLLPSFTIMSCVLAVLYNGARPVLVDVDPDTWTMDPASAAAKITPRTRALMPVHIYGHPCDMAPLEALTRERGLALVEDGAEAHGAEYRGRRCGSFGAASCFSFFANKAVTTGEGGMIVTDDPDLAERARVRRNLGFGAENKFLHAELGYNFRLSGLQAALGLAQIEGLDAHLRRKRAVARAYARALRDIPGLALPAEKSWARSSWWMCGVLLEPSLGRDAAWLAAQLERSGVETRPFFLGMHEQPVLTSRGLFAGESYPVTERLSRQGLILPSGAGLSEQDISRVARAAREALGA